MSSAASIRARLLNVARERGVDFNLLLVTYGLQRVLYRLSLSASPDQFVLKGAQLLQQLLPGIGFRPTRDADLTSAVGLGEEAIRRLFRSAMEAEAEDGLVFDADSLKVEGLRGQTEMGGLQVSLLAYLAGARIPVRVDVSVSDAMVPDPVDVEFRTLLDMPAPRLKGYAIETVIAEKLHAMAALGLVNTRLKDYFDLWMIQQHFAVRESELIRALLATFGHRSTPIEADLIGLSSAFFGDPERVRMWNRTLTTMGAETVSLATVCALIAGAFRPALVGASKLESSSEQ